MLEIKNISVRLGSFSLNDVSLRISEKDYFVLLGSSGSGKTVLLEIIAGLIKPQSGIIVLQGREITHVRMQKRGIGLVFQDYAIFPHYTVFENIAFPLRQLKYRSSEIRDTVFSLAADLNITPILERSPAKLSGGEKQRVALARTLAMKPEILLLDEPLASLDSQLRNDTRFMLRKLNQKGQTIIHVTHDYEEAILLANKVAVINNGTIEQEGSPKEIFQHPKSQFVASMAGVRNFFRATVIPKTQMDSSTRVLVDGNVNMLVNIQTDGKEGVISIDSREIVISPEKPETSMTNNYSGKVVDIFSSRYGAEILVDIGIPLYVLITEESLHKYQIEIQKPVWVSFKASALKFVAD